MRVPLVRLQVYTAEYGGHLLALKLFRYSTSMDYAAGAAHPNQLHGGPGGGAAAAAGISNLLGHHGTSSSSGGNVANEAELEAVLSLQYRLCNLSHQHLLQHVAVYPRVYEVSTGGVAVVSEQLQGWHNMQCTGSLDQHDCLAWSAHSP